MNEELPPNLRPSEVAPEDQQLVEEVVSSVQPHKSWFSRRHVETSLMVVLVVFVLGYLVFVGRSALQLRVKVANAPEDIINNLQTPVHTASTADSGLPAVIVNPDQPSLVQPPALVIDETSPVPRISSTYTNEPSVVAQPTPPAKVAGANTRVTPAYTYTSAHGFSFRAPAGSTVQEVEQGRVAVFNAKGKVLSEVVVLPNATNFVNGIPAELALSSNISNIGTGTVGAQPAYVYTVNGSVKGASVTYGPNTYYITDYSGALLPTFILR
ncbi:MAG: hypothetical protein JNK33_02520 [Candidatus Doudnabacteria bacterium]|nr:hypothetical protein [Candidatus Doudnabacteria bacterium]